MSQQQMMVVLGADIGDFQRAMGQVQGQMRDTAEQVNGSMDGATNSVTRGTNGIKSALKGIAGVMATAFAVDKIKDFAVSAIEAGAEAEAMTAQFDQVFGDIGDMAQDTIDGLGSQFGMLPNRIKPAMTSMTSMFKGLGMDTEEAMGTAEKAVSLVADAGAFYDKSFEDANASLNSFIKGNYEGGESIGLFANETQLASWASKELGEDWKTLDEKGKQVTRLKFAESMMEASGATGQASREADSYQNQLGNLKQAWTDMKAKFGQPFLEIVINSFKKLTEWVQKIDVEAIIGKFKNLMSYMGTVVSPIIDAVKDNFKEFMDFMNNSGSMDSAKSALDSLKEPLGWFVDNLPNITKGIGEFIDKFDFLIAGVAGGVLAFQLITGAVTLWNNIVKVAKAVQLAWNAVMLANPIGLIAIAIGVLIAVGILLYKNWDTIKEKMGQAWQFIYDKAVEVFDGMKVKIDTAMKFIESIFTSAMQWLASVTGTNFDSIKDKVSLVMEGVRNIVDTIWNYVKTSFLNALNLIKALVTGDFSKVKEIIGKQLTLMKETVSSLWSSVKMIFSNALGIIKEFVTSRFNEIKNSIKTKLTEAKNSVSTILDGIKSKATSTFNSVKTAMTRPITEAKDKIKGIIDTIKGFFSNLSLKFPKISMPKMPKFSVTGSFGLNPPSVPKLGLSWHANGGIIKGSNGGTVVGVGENGGDEAIVPLSNKSRMKPFAHAVANMMPESNGGGGNIENNFQIASLVVREEADIGKIATELYKMQRKKSRSGGM